MRSAGCLCFCLVLTACGSRGPIQLDIVDVGPARSSAMAAPATADQTALDVSVRAAQLGPALDNGTAFELAIVDCGSPAAVRAAAPLSLGGEPVTGLASSQIISDDPDMQVLLDAAVPREALAIARPCARLMAANASSSAEIVSAPVALRSE